VSGLDTDWLAGAEGFEHPHRGVTIGDTAPHENQAEGPLFRGHFAHRLTESAQLRSVEPTPRMPALEIGFRRAEIIA
jgi:hypothetical protein